MGCDTLDDCKAIGKEDDLPSCLSACADSDACFADFGADACAKVCTGVLLAFDHHSDAYAQCAVDTLGPTCDAAAVPGVCF